MQQGDINLVQEQTQLSLERDPMGIAQEIEIYLNS